MITFAPPLTRSSAKAAPMPLLAPVIQTICPIKAVAESSYGSRKTRRSASIEIWIAINKAIIARNQSPPRVARGLAPEPPFEPESPLESEPSCQAHRRKSFSPSQLCREQVLRPTLPPRLNFFFFVVLVKGCGTRRRAEILDPLSRLRWVNRIGHSGRRFPNYFSTKSAG